MAGKNQKRHRDKEPDSIVGPVAATNPSDVANVETRSETLEHPDDRINTRDQMTETADQRTDDSVIDRSVVDALDSSTEVLQYLLVQLSDFREAVVAGSARVGTVSEEDSQAECRQLRDRVWELEDEVGELRQQNSDLASRVASSNVRQTVSTAASGCHESLSWEDRKKLILQQMEQDAFDEAAFASSLQDQSSDKPESPSEFVEHLYAELEARDADLSRRDEEIRELRCLLEQQSETRQCGVAIGAAAIAQMIDADELVQEERHRLQLLQAEWEEKFRQSEIEASLERAKLSRERQQLAIKQTELEEQLEHVRRQSRQDQEVGSASSRRWLAKLGLTDHDRK